MPRQLDAYEAMSMYTKLCIHKSYGASTCTARLDVMYIPGLTLISTFAWFNIDHRLSTFPPSCNHTADHHVRTLTLTPAVCVKCKAELHQPRQKAAHRLCIRRRHLRLRLPSLWRSLWQSRGLRPLVGACRHRKRTRSPAPLHHTSRIEFSCHGHIYVSAFHIQIF